MFGGETKKNRRCAVGTISNLDNMGSVHPFYEGRISFH